MTVSTLSVRLRRSAAALALGIALAGCGGAVNPATGQSEFSLIPESQDYAMGAEAHREVIAEYGGVYENPRVQAFVENIGRRLAQATGRPDIRYTFTLLDSDMVNAFATPGGFVYITRGMLAVAQDEADIAAVMGHEIGHVTARHSASRQTQSVFAQLGAAVLGAVTGSEGLANIAGVGAGAWLAKHSRDDEFQADELGVRYLVGAGYDPGAMSTLLQGLERSSQLEQAMAGGRGGGFDFFSTHPQTPDRIERAERMAAQTGQQGGYRGREEYLRAVDGMTYGENPSQGLVEGTGFVHPELGFRFDVPRGFRIRNAPDKVTATAQDGSAIVFDMEGQARQFGGSMAQYLARGWPRDIPLDDIRPIRMPGGVDAATGTARLQAKGGGRVDARFVAIRTGEGDIYRFRLLTQRLTRDLDAAFLETAASLRPLSAGERSRIRPARLRVVQVRPGDTVQSLAARMNVPDTPVERFLVLNALGQRDQLQPGWMVKVVE